MSAVAVKPLLLVKNVRLLGAFRASSYFSIKSTFIPMGCKQPSQPLIWLPFKSSLYFKQSWKAKRINWKIGKISWFLVLGVLKWLKIDLKLDSNCSKMDSNCSKMDSNCSNIDWNFPKWTRIVLKKWTQNGLKWDLNGF